MKAIVIGAGPAGLLAAYLLAQQGYQVTVLEAEDKIGGRLKPDTFSDGSTLSVGATWIHNSEHPITHVLEADVDQRDLSEGILKEPCVFIENLHKTLMATLAETEDFAERRKISDLTWPILIQAFEETEDAAQPAYIRTLKPIYQQYLQPLLQSMVDAYNKKLQLPPSSISTLIAQEDFFNSLDFDVEIDDSVLGDQHFSDSENLGSTEMIPKKGFHHLVQYLHDKIRKEYNDRVKILTNHQVSRIQENANQIKLVVNLKTSDADKIGLICYQQKSQTKILSADKLVVAIAPNHYRTINFFCNALPEIRGAIEHLHPSNIFKIAVLLDKPLNAANKVVCIIKTPILTSAPLSDARPMYDAVKIKFTPETENSKILVGFLHKDFLRRLENKNDIEEQLANVLLAQGVRILEIRRYYETGESWFLQKRGFLPILNAANSKILYLGTVTGCSDAVHSVLTNTCVQLGVNPKLLTEIFLLPSKTQHARRLT